MSRAPSGGGPALTVALATEPADRSRVMDFVRGEYLRVYNTSPGEPEALWYAESDREIVATVGVDLGRADAPPELHRVYGCDGVDVAPGYTPATSAQITRWISTVPFGAPLVMHAAARWSLARGRPHLLFEAKPDIARHLEGFGALLRQVPEVSLAYDQVQPGDFDYYMTDPPPRLYHVLASALADHLDPAARASTPGADDHD
ncbi:hypothetical protein ABTY63_28420 [Streptomyces solisilvae]|uniref:hypothetical protein n=1 Tax=Streptomyces malaysiensis TaxID=92644 RepID=UPI0033225476